MIKNRYDWMLCLFLLIFTSSMAGKGQLKSLHSYSLSEAIDLGVAANPQTRALHYDKLRNELHLKRIRSTRILPQFSLSGELGIVPEARGDIFSSPDKQSDLDAFGPFYKLELSLVQPVLTFGRIKPAKLSARAAIRIQRFTETAELEKIRFQVINAFWAVHSADQAVSLSRKLVKDFEKLEKETRERLQREDSDIDDSDLLEVKTNRFQIEEIEIRSQTEKRKATHTFNALLGKELAEPVGLQVPDIPELNFSEDQLNQWIDREIKSHHQIKKIDAAIEAIEAQSEMAYRKKMPIIYLAGGVGVAYAPKREDQTNPFAVDNFNYLDFGIYMGFKWDLNLFRKNIKYEQYRLKKRSIQQRRKLAKMKIRLEILEAYIELERNRQLYTRVQSSLKAAKSWLRLGMDNWDMGIGSVERLVKAYNRYYQLRGLRIKQLLDLNLSIAKMSYIMGSTSQYLEWIKNGKIEINR